MENLYPYSKKLSVENECYYELPQGNYQNEENVKEKKILHQVIVPFNKVIYIESRSIKGKKELKILLETGSEVLLTMSEEEQDKFIKNFKRYLERYKK